MRSTVRAYSHQGHGPRADQQAGYISATSDSTTSLAKGSRSIHSGHDRKTTTEKTNVRLAFKARSFAVMHADGEVAPRPVIHRVASSRLGRARGCLSRLRRTA